jgi:hypothetical protein
MGEKIPENKLERLSNDKFRLTTRFERLTRVDEFDKTFLKESYVGGVKEYNDIVEQFKKVNKKLKDTEFSKEDEIRVKEFIELNNLAHKYEEYQKSLGQRDGMIDLMKRLANQKEDIEKVCPELKRHKK